MYQSVKVKNLTAEVAPPGCVLEVAGPIDQDGTIHVRKPTLSNGVRFYFNGFAAIPASAGGVFSVGEAFPIFPRAVAGVVAADGLTGLVAVGTKAGDWYLRSGQTGFFVVGTPSHNFANVMPEPGTAAAAGSNWFLCRITGGDEAAGYSGVEVDYDTGTALYVAVTGGVTFTHTGRRGPSKDYDPPTIPVGQLALAEESALSPGQYKLTPWGGQLRYTQKVYDGSYCDGGNLVNVYKRIRVYATNLCKTPGSSGDAP